MKFPFQINETEASRMFPIDYAGLAREAHGKSKLAANDAKKIGLLAIDVQGTFCVPSGELFVSGAPADTVRSVRFLEGNFDAITQIACTMDTHRPYQIFHPSFLVDEAGNHPAPFTPIPVADVKAGKWKVNPAVPFAVLGKPDAYMAMQQWLVHYCEQLEAASRYTLFIWPYHAMIGGINHALVSMWEQAIYMHSIARGTEVRFETKGGNGLSENYSVLRPEVLTDPSGRPMLQKNIGFIEALLKFDLLVILGQAKSHCVAWTIYDLLAEIKSRDPKLAQKVAIVGDCTSSVTGFETQGDAAFADFQAAGMRIIDSNTDVRSLV